MKCGEFLDKPKNWGFQEVPCAYWGACRPRAWEVQSGGNQLCIHHGVVCAMATSRRYGGLDGEGRGPVALIGLHSLWAVYNFTLTFWGRL